MSSNGAEMDPREINALMNRFRREAQKHAIGSPYRINEYCILRSQGKSEEDALRLTRNGEK